MTLRDTVPCRYLALVLGRLTGSGVIDHPVGGFPAVSLFRVEGHRPSGVRRGVRGRGVVCERVWAMGGG
jgi:hypothetical protein